MLKEKLIAILKTLGLYTEEKKAEIDKALDAIEEPKQKQKSAQAEPDGLVELQEAVESLKEQNKQLINAISEEKKSRESAQKTISDQMKAEKTKKIETAIDKAKDDRKITEAQVEGWRKMLELDYDTASAQLSALQINPALQSPNDKKLNSKTPNQPPNKNIGLAGAAEPKILDSIMKMANITDN